MSWPLPDSNTPASAASLTTPPALIAFTLAVVVVCFVGFTVVYFCRCYFVSVIHTWAFQSSASGTLHLAPNSTPYTGLDPSLLQNFPTFLYASVKDLRRDKYSLECAICLLEFDEECMIRLLNVCCHVFHQECIDLWLQSHKTCPVCRTDLESPADNETRNSLGEDNVHNVEEDRRVSSGEDHEIRIDVKEDEGEGGEGDDKGAGYQREHARSHSTGHSIVMIRSGGGDEGKDDDDDDKYMLRLPEHVTKGKLIRGGHNYTRSCLSYEEMTMIRSAVVPCSTCGHVLNV